MHLQDSAHQIYIQRAFIVTYQPQTNRSLDSAAVAIRRFAPTTVCSLALSPFVIFVSEQI